MYNLDFDFEKILKYFCPDVLTQVVFSLLQGFPKLFGFGRPFQITLNFPAAKVKKLNEIDFISGETYVASSFLNFRSRNALVYLYLLCCLQLYLVNYLYRRVIKTPDFFVNLNKVNNICYVDIPVVNPLLIL